jgi:hypothetical protein
MPGPFPGMDPYLEDPAHWPDVHQRLITYIADTIGPPLRPRYHARIGERVYILEPPHLFYPDVTIIRQPLTVREPAPVYAATAEAETEVVDVPVLVTLPPVEHREPYLEIVHAAGGEVVTVIEVLSPANKAPGEGHRLYRSKQQELLDTPIHLVEIDLLSSGLHTVALSEEGRAGLPPHRYLICVRRGPERRRFEVYPIPLSRRLPRMRIPLKEPDPDVVLDVQAVLDRCYDNGGYADLIDYRRPPSAPLSPEEAAWVDGLLRGKGLR